MNAFQKGLIFLSISLSVACSTIQTPPIPQEYSELDVPSDFDYHRKGQLQNLDQGYYYNTHGQQVLLTRRSSAYTPAKHLPPSHHVSESEQDIPLNTESIDPIVIKIQ